MTVPPAMAPSRRFSGGTAHRAVLAVCLFLLFSSLFWPTAIRAEGAVISNLILSSQNDSMTVHLRTEGAFTPEIEAAVKSGVPVTFSYFLVLEAPRSFRPAKTLSDITVTHTIRYNAIRENYTVTRSWEGFTPHISTDFQDAQKQMCTLSNLSIADHVVMEKGKEYRLRAKAKLGELTLPLYLHHILFFLAFWDFETDWYSIDFIF